MISAVRFDETTFMTSFLLFGGLSMGELIVVAIIGLLLFGRRLPEISRSLGRSVVEFKRGFQDIEREVHEVDRLSDRAAAQSVSPKIPASAPNVNAPSTAESSTPNGESGKPV